MTAQAAADLAARETKVADQEAALAAREAEAVKAEHTSFAEGLIKEGRLRPVHKDAVVASLVALPTDGDDVSFADGDGKDQTGSAVDALKAVLASGPVLVSFGAADLGDDPNNVATASFASDGKAVDSAQLAVDAKARAYQVANPGTEYLAAVRAVS